MNIQAILDEIARTLGGTLIRAGVYGGTGALAAGGKTIKLAYSLLPEFASVGEDGLIAVVFWDGMTVDPEGPAAGDLTVYRHRMRIQLMLSAARSDLPKAMSILTPFVPVIRNAFAAKVRLGGVGAVANSVLEASEGIVPAIYDGRLALDLTLSVDEKEAVAYAA